MKKITAIFILNLSFIVSLHAAIAIPKEDLLKTGYQADYDVNYNGMGIGVSKRVLTVNDNKATYKATTVPEGFAAVLIKETATETSSIEMSPSVIRPTLYHYEKNKKGNISTYQLKFDWNKNLYNNSYLKTKEKLKANTHDLLSFQLAIIRDVLNNKRAMHYYVATKKHTRLYTLKFMANEEITADDNDFKTLKFETNILKGNSKFTFWCAPKLGYLPIKIQKTNDNGDTFSFILRDLMLPK